ncbi:MAG: hypothetical protein IKS93_04480 [Methanobrevibacter sp.]|nr:hypothetical protein [Methanobrevibacter sp.]
MSVENFLSYEAYINLMDRQLEIFGQPATIFSPERKVALGYEDVGYNEIAKLDSDKVLGNKYHKYPARIWINFTIPKSVFYKFNWFPEDSEELCTAFINSEVPLKENDYIRTAVPEATSIWGDMIFVVAKIQDEGLAQVLKRTYFLKPTGNADLHGELSF